MWLYAAAVAPLRRCWKAFTSSSSTKTAMKVSYRHHAGAYMQIASEPPNNALHLTIALPRKLSVTYAALKDELACP